VEEDERGGLVAADGVASATTTHVAEHGFARHRVEDVGPSRGTAREDRPMRRILGTACLPLLLASCSGDSPAALAPVSLLDDAAASVAAVDVSGSWAWTRTDHLTFPPFAATAIFGVEPEGRTTVATCHTEGTLELTQSGSEFQGQEVTTSSACETQGGQDFALAPNAAMTGEVVGLAALHMTFRGGVECHYNGAARDVVDGVAGTLEASGRCVIPGHPQSGVPGFDPPPAGTEVVPSWEARRR
jgi:hypothetical protein